MSDNSNEVREVQRGMAGRNAGVPHEQRIDFRVGINVGEIIIENEDIFDERAEKR